MFLYSLFFGLTTFIKLNVSKITFFLSNLSASSLCFISGPLFISSIYGIIGPDSRIYSSQKFRTLSGYSASKAGLIGLSKWLATNYAQNKIRVNTIIPGGIKDKQNKLFVKNAVKAILIIFISHLNLPLYHSVEGLLPSVSRHHKM